MGSQFAVRVRVRVCNLNACLDPSLAAIRRLTDRLAIGLSEGNDTPPHG